MATRRGGDPGGAARRRARARGRRLLGSGAAAEPARRGDHPLRPAQRPLAAVTPIAVRLRARSLQSVGRTAGRLFSVSTAGSIVGTLATSFFLIPEFGIDQLIGLAAAALFAAVAVVAVAERMLLAALVAVAATVGAAAGSLRARAGAGGVLSEAAAQNWSPLYRTRGAETYLDARDPRAASPARAARSSTRGTRSTTASRSSRTRTRATCASTRRSRARCTSTTPFAPASLHGLLPPRVAYNPEARDVLFVGLGAGSSPKRDAGATSPTCGSRRSSSTRWSSTWRSATSRCPRTTRASTIERRRRAPLPRRRGHALGRDRDRRVLRRRDPVPPRHARVPGARAVAARARRRRRDERDRRARGAGLTPLPLDLPDVSDRLPDGARPPGDPPRGRGRRRRTGT